MEQSFSLHSSRLIPFSSEIPNPVLTSDFPAPRVSHVESLGNDMQSSCNGISRPEAEGELGKTAEESPSIKKSKKIGAKRLVWTKEKDEYLRTLVSKYSRQWFHIASLMAQKFPGFTPNRQQCGKHWDNFARPGLNTGEWSDLETALLKEKYRTYGSSWSRYQADFPDRSQLMIGYRCKSLFGHVTRIEEFEQDIAQGRESLPADDRVVNDAKRRFNEISTAGEASLSLKKQKAKPIEAKIDLRKSHWKNLNWTREQDQFLRSLVYKCGRRWKVISKLMTDQFHDFVMNARQCGERWDNYLDPELNKEPWTVKEKDLLKEKFKVYGKSWKRYQEDFPGRTQHAIRKLWVSMCRSASEPISSRVDPEAFSEEGIASDPEDTLLAFLPDPEAITYAPAEYNAPAIDEFEELTQEKYNDETGYDSATEHEKRELSEDIDPSHLPLRPGSKEFLSIMNSTVKIPFSPFGLL